MTFLTIIYSLIAFEFCKAAFVQISLPSSAVEMGTDVKIAVDKMSPNISNPKFDRLDCGIISPDDPIFKIIVAQYDKHSLKFKTPSHGIPKKFRERISYVGDLSFVVQNIQFEDKSLKSMCILNYKNASLTKHADSRIYEITIVYVSPKFHFDSTREGNVAIRQGQKTTIQCVAKSFPQSDIYWETSIGKNAYHSESSISQQKREFTMKSTFAMVTPNSTYDGKKVDCIVKPKYGRTIRRRFTLSYKHEEKKKEEKDDKNLGLIIGLSIGGAVVVAIVIVIVVYKCRK